MKRSAGFILTLALLYVVVSTAHARPWWKTMDVETANAPSQYGYHVSRTAAQDKDHYVITIDPAAAAVLTGASIGWTGVSKGPQKMEITEINGQKKIEFTVPPEYLQPGSYLRLESGPIPYSGDERLIDFDGYSLRLDNIPRDSGYALPFIPDVRMLDGGFEFSYSLYEPFSISSPGPEFKLRVLSITLESDANGRISVPMALPESYVREPVKFFISKSQVEHFSLVVVMTNQGDFAGSKATKHYVRLGVIAANAELAANQKKSDSQPPR